MNIRNFLQGPVQNNEVTPNLAADVALVYARLGQLPYFNLPAWGMMEVAHDLFMHGSPQEAKFAECIVSGVAQGLGVGASEGDEYPICPSCGKRHRPIKELLDFLASKRKSLFGGI